jgi:UDP-N-acetylmuramoylalanine-D-glutamate ligase
MELSINELSKLTGKDRRTITTKLNGLPFKPGSKAAMLYDSAAALERIYAINARKISLDEARTRQALSQEALNRVREEELRKTRIPIDLVMSIMDQTLQSICATLKAAKGQMLTLEKINEILADFRSIPEKLRL